MSLERVISRGIFQETVTLINRAPVDLTVQFDGQCKTLTPGPNEVPNAVVAYAKNQNPIMGTQDPYNPHISGCRYLVGVRGTKDNCKPLTKAEWEEHLNRPCREDERQWFADKYGNDPKAKLVTYGKGRQTAATSRYDAGGAESGKAAFGERG